MTKLPPDLNGSGPWLRIAVLTACIVMFLQPGNAQTYNVISADVPFEFMVGTRTFAPGHYELVLTGNGLLAVRDAQKRTVAALITRSVDSRRPLPTTKLVFKLQDKHQHLSQIWVENQLEILEVMREEVAMRQQRPSAAASIWFDANSFLERNGPPAMRR